jgi:hypothetical protein
MPGADLALQRAQAAPWLRKWPYGLWLGGIRVTSVAVTLARWAAKLADCVRGLARPTRDGDPAQWTWDNAATTLRRYLP